MLKILARNAVFEGTAVEKAIKTKYEGKNCDILSLDISEICYESTDDGLFSHARITTVTVNV